MSKPLFINVPIVKPVPQVEGVNLDRIAYADFDFGDGKTMRISAGRPGEAFQELKFTFATGDDLRATTPQGNEIEITLDHGTAANNRVELIQTAIIGLVETGGLSLQDVKVVCNYEDADSPTVLPTPLTCNLSRGRALGELEDVSTELITAAVPTLVERVRFGSELSSMDNGQMAFCVQQGDDVSLVKSIMFDDFPGTGGINGEVVLNLALPTNAKLLVAHNFNEDGGGGANVLQEFIKLDFTVLGGTLA